ncbi:hypothetical protein LRAMOSA10236 [Lichtheimia ramosa]|uniref:Heterokaryon incompatibility domain-containing protein n=1 Tax=Lichtheimia ramosa TaxID=688394 RepID=A0A077WND5_9FUNG|nr:hypothetical protein LRAMOSA10236 [Lichtheimia ramosa]
MIKRINEARDVPSFYYALSHLWGISNENRYHWNDISNYVIDEQGQPVKPVSMRPEKRDKLLAMLMGHPDSYWWIDVLCARTDTPLDIMGDIYACCLECIAMIDCDPTLISEINKFNAETSQSSKVQICSLVHKFIKSRWWQRVWTWQEMALPLDVRFMAETGAYQAESSTITIKEILPFAQLAIEINANDHTDEYIETMTEAALAVRNALLEMKAARKFRADDIAKTNSYDVCPLFLSLNQSPRRCMNQVDYVYGVLGILGFKIPRKKDPIEVWQLFLHELTNNMGDSTRGAEFFDRAVKFDLQKAETLGDVYNELFDIYSQMYGVTITYGEAVTTVTRSEKKFRRLALFL